MIDLSAPPEQEETPEFDPDDWFGDESAFSSSEDLASALFALGGVVAPQMDFSHAADDDEEEEYQGPYAQAPPQFPMQPAATAVPTTIQPPPPRAPAPAPRPPESLPYVPSGTQGSPEIPLAGPTQSGNPFVLPLPTTPPSQPPDQTHQLPAAYHAPVAPVIHPFHVMGDGSTGTSTAPTPPPGMPTEQNPSGGEIQKRWADMQFQSYVPTGLHGPLPQQASDEPAPTLSERVGYRSREVARPDVSVSVDPNLPSVKWSTRSSMKELRSTERIIEQLQKSATHISWTAAALSFREINAISLRHRFGKAATQISSRGFDK